MRDGEGGISPLASSDGLVVKELSGEILVYDLERHRAHCLNSAAARVWKLCDGRTDVAEMKTSLTLHEDETVNGELIWLALAQLKKANLLVSDSQPSPTETRSVSRREMVRKLGAGAALALPLVTSLLAPTPAQAASCLPSGSPCGSSAECCSGVCAGSTCA
jgi:hypothetical protein